MFEQDYDALNWLCEKSEFPRIYAPLRTGFPRDPESKQYIACFALAEILRDQTDVIRRLIHHHDWRNQVIGNMVVVLNHGSCFEVDYVEKLENGRPHFPEPLAAGWAIVATDETVPLLRSYLNKLIENDDQSTSSVRESSVLAIYSALRALDKHYVKKFEDSSLFAFLKSTNFFPHTVETTANIYLFYKSYLNSLND